MLCRMSGTLNIRSERVDDIPVIIGVVKQLKMAEVVDRCIGTHGLQQGLSNGWLTVGWLAYILSQADHRKAAVREWANDLPHTLETLRGQPLRAGEFSDDRLGGVLHRLSDDVAWEALERELWTATVAVDEVEVSGIRLDSTTSSGYDQVSEEGVMQFGHSKD